MHNCLVTKSGDVMLLPATSPRGRLRSMHVRSAQLITETLPYPSKSFMYRVAAGSLAGRALSSFHHRVALPCSYSGAFSSCLRAGLSHHLVSMSSAGSVEVSMLSKEDAAAVDKELMSTGGFSLDQLMELAGLSVASAVEAEYPPTTYPRVLVLAGPGNNGGDGLVAARHLVHFGYAVRIVYPKRTQREPFSGLVTQTEALGIEYIEDIAALGNDVAAWNADVVLDAMFGFSFHPPVRPPFDEVVAALANRPVFDPDAPRGSTPVLVAVDVPTGWDVDAGPPGLNALAPDLLVSLTAPKRCAAAFDGAHHYLGGRFVPPQIVAKYNLRLPAYHGAAQCVRIGGAVGGGKCAHLPAASVPALADMRLSYEAGMLWETEAAPDPINQFARWFEDAKAHPGVEEPNAMVLSTTGENNAPSARVVLLKGFDGKGFAFFTNYTSRKGQELEQHAAAALTFFWEPLQRQVRIEGRVHKVPAAESEAYFHSRPRGSQIGAWASRQSAPLDGGREVLERRVEALERQFHDQMTIPYPDYWGGYVLDPEAVEFWQGRPSRLHDRLLYTKQDGQWKTERLQP